MRLPPNLHSNIAGARPLTLEENCGALPTMIPLTFTPFAPTSFASDAVSATSPALAAA